VKYLLLSVAALNQQLSPHFKASEFYSTSPDRPKQHEIAEPCVLAAEILRTHFDKPWRITSTFRTEAHERQILKAQGVPYFLSQHTRKKAFDSQPADNSPETMREIWLDFTSEGELYQKLRAVGITGFGIYNTFIHLDCRDDEFKAKRRDKWGLVARWDSRTGAARKLGNFLGGAVVSKPANTTPPKPSSTPPVVKKAPVAKPLTPASFTQARRPSAASCSR
jgi:hypothetical protein